MNHSTIKDALENNPDQLESILHEHMLLWAIVPGTKTSLKETAGSFAHPRPGSEGQNKKTLFMRNGKFALTAPRKAAKLTASLMKSPGSTWNIMGNITINAESFRENMTLLIYTPPGSAVL